MHLDLVNADVKRLHLSYLPVVTSFGNLFQGYSRLVIYVGVLRCPSTSDEFLSLANGWLIPYSILVDRK